MPSMDKLGGSAQGRLAVLIDADNASPGTVEELMAEVVRYGAATIKRAYGDWTTPNLQGWKEVLHRHAVQAQFICTTMRSRACGVTMTGNWKRWLNTLLAVRVLQPRHPIEYRLALRVIFPIRHEVPMPLELELLVPLRLAP